VITGLPANAQFTLRRDGKIVASPRATPEGVIELSVADITKSTQLGLEGENQ
jgi:hypothetical protein